VKLRNIRNQFINFPQHKTGITDLNGFTLLNSNVRFSSELNCSFAKILNYSRSIKCFAFSQSFGFQFSCRSRAVNLFHTNFVIIFMSKLWLYVLPNLINLYNNFDFVMNIFRKFRNYKGCCFNKIAESGFIKT
jgi:hypothetical protein